MEHAKSSYDNRFKGGVSIGRVPVVMTPSKKVRWVDSNGGSNGDGSFHRPYATVDAAINASGAGDVILIKENHAETLTTANTVTQDVAGVAVVGLGSGNRRPTFTFTPSAVGDNPWAISAASCSVRNIIGKPGLDAITNPFNISAAGVSLDIEWQDASSAIEAETVVLTTAAADNLDVNIVYRGFSAGNACVAPVKLVGCTDGRINVDFHGVASTSIVNFITTLSTNILVTGYAFNSGTTDGSKLVLDTIGSSTWFVDIYDGAAGSRFTGGSAGAVGLADVFGTVATAAATGAVTATDKMMAYIKQLVTELQVVDEFHDVPAADNVLNAQINEVIGNKTDAAAAGAVTTTDTLVGYVKQLVTELAVVDEFHDVPAADATANAQVNEVLGNKEDAAQVTVGTTRSLVGYLKGLMNSTIRTIEKTDGAVLNGKDPLFTITGGPIHVRSLIGVVTTIIGGVANGNLGADVTEPAGTVALSTTVAVDNDAAGTIYTFLGPTAVLTPTTAGASILDMGTVVAGGNSASIVPAQWIVPVGNIHFQGSAAQTGVIKWYMTYEPLSPSAVVTAAA